MFDKLKFTEQHIPKGVTTLVNFGKYQLSVVCHQGSYGGKQGLFEIGVFQGADMVELPGITQEGDTVKGFLTKDDVSSILKKMILITGNDPLQLNAPMVEQVDTTDLKSVAYGVPVRVRVGAPTIQLNV